MLDERVDTLRAIVVAHHQEMRRLIGALSDADLDRRTEIGWSVRAVAGHIAQAPSSDIYVARRLAAGKSATLPGFLFSRSTSRTGLRPGSSRRGRSRS